jgi:hypothetical protein
MEEGKWQKLEVWKLSDECSELLAIFTLIGKK